MLLRFATLVFCLVAVGSNAQLLDAPSGAAGGFQAQEAPKETTVMFQVGAVVTAKRGAVQDIYATVAVPIECDEQTVKLVKEDFSPEVAGVEFRDLAGGNARQMLVSIPYLESGAEARAVLVYEVTTRTTPPLEESAAAELSIPRRPPRGLRGYVGPSPFIESKHPKFRRFARDLLKEVDAENPGADDYTRIEALYDYVLDNIEYIEGPDTSAMTTLDEGSADCHGRSALFVALCRASGVPSRMVWVNDHCYPEFYLQREDDEGMWLPAESAGTRAFGEMPIARVILQKGDNFRVPERPTDRLRYASDYLTGRPVRGSGKPSVKYLREVVQ